MPKPAARLTREEVEQRLVLTVAEVAAILECHPNSIYNWTADGTLPCTRIGSRVLIPAKAVLAMFDAVPSDPSFDGVTALAP